MARIETWLRCNLQSMVRVQELSGDLFTADNQANRIGVIVTDNNGQPVQLTGGVIGYIIRPDEATVVVNGSISSNRAWIDLPASAYAVKGPISIVIKNGNTTIGACHGYIKRSTTDRIIDPGHEVPSLSELLAEIANMRTATSAANTAASSATSAAGAANTAATNANNKANVANTAAGAANTAATNANGAAGKINNMTVAASGLAAGSAPTVAVSDVNGHKHILFGIPKGDKGDPGKDFRIKKTFASIAQMEAYDPSQDQSKYKVLEFDYVMIDTGSVSDVDTGKLYCYEPHEQTVWHYIGDLSGTQGIKGETGNGISSVHLNQDYTLTISFTDGTSVTTTSIRGASGNETIDDTAGLGNTDLVYSADKLTKELSQKANGENLYSYKSKSGSIVTVDDAVAEAVKQMRIEIAPVQYLHGYDHPWPAGGGKNIFQNTMTSGTKSNVVFTVNQDGSVKANGTANGNVSSDNGTFGTITLEPGTYYVSGCNTGTNNQRMVLQYGASDYATLYDGTVKSFTLTSSYTCLLYVIILSGEVVNTTFYPMISKENTGVFAPYSNICPISGWTGANVTRTGKNIFDPNHLKQVIDDMWGHKYTVPGSYAIYAYGSGSTLYAYVRKKAANGTFTTIGYPVQGNTVNSIITSIQEGEELFVFCGSSGKTESSVIELFNAWKLQVVYDNVQPSAYIPFGTVYPITFPTSAGTVYGGTLTVNKDGSGELVVDRANIASYNGETLTSTWISDRDVYAQGTTPTTGAQVVYELATPVTYSITAPEIITLLSGLNNVWSDTGDILSMLYPVNNKADKDGEYEHLTAGSALQLLGQYTDESVPYMFRKTPVNSKRVREKLVGGTIAWNQLFGNVSVLNDGSANGLTWSYDNATGTLTIDGTSTGRTGILDFYFTETTVLANQVVFIKNNGFTLHMDRAGWIVNTDDAKNYSIVKAQNTLSLSNGRVEVMYEGKTFSNAKYQFIVCNLTAMFGSTIADAIYVMEQATAGSGVAWFRSLFPKEYYEYTAGELMSVQAKEKVTTGKNLATTQIYKDGYVLASDGSESASSGYVITERINVLPDQNYKITYLQPSGSSETMRIGFYDGSNNFISRPTYSTNSTVTTPSNARYAKLSYAKTIYNVQFEFGTTATTYEPYTPQIYPFDSDLTLRGIPKWNSTSGKMYYDGDEYESSGKVTRKYGVITITANDITDIATNGRSLHYCKTSLSASDGLDGNSSDISAHGVASNGFKVVVTGNYWSYDRYISITSSGINITCDDCDTIEKFKALCPITCIYELATPTTETAEPYHEVQICDGNGTEEFVDGGNRDVSVPVGHASKYSADIWQIIADLQAAILALGT